MYVYVRLSFKASSTASEERGGGTESDVQCTYVVAGTRRGRLPLKITPHYTFWWRRFDVKINFDRSSLEDDSVAAIYLFYMQAS